MPDYYISKKDAYLEGWKNNEQNLSTVLPGYCIGGDIYYNAEGKLPHAKNRVWFEADIDYTLGKRNSKRILYSNDGLMFVTYNHYETFVEIR